MTQPLSKSDQRIVTSIFKHIQKEVIANGYMPNVDNYNDTEIAAIAYNTQIGVIQGTKGFDIEVYNHSSARRKAAKKTPRFVIYQSRTYDGEVGAPVHAIFSNDKTVGNKFKSGFMPQKASSVVVAIHLISALSNQFYTLNSILANVIGQRQYLKIYNELDNTYLEQRFLCEQTSFNDLDDSLEGVFEKIFFYTVPDVYLSDMRDTREVSPIKQITVKTETEDPFIEVKSPPTGP